MWLDQRPVLLPFADGKVRLSMRLVNQETGEEIADDRPPREEGDRPKRDEGDRGGRDRKRPRRD